MGGGASHVYVSKRQKEILRQQRIKRQEIRQQQKKAKQAEQEAKKAERERIRLERGEPPESSFWSLEWWKKHVLRLPWRLWADDTAEEGPAPKGRKPSTATDYELLGIPDGDSAQPVSIASTGETAKPGLGMPHADGELRRRK
jgi:hypothetical protein